MKNKYMLKSRKDFDNLFLKKTSYYSSFYIIYYTNNDIEKPRFAISVSKKLQKKAVIRNVAKRQIKSILTQFSKLNLGVDLIVIVKSKFFNVDFATKKRDLESILYKVFNIK